MADRGRFVALMGFRAIRPLFIISYRLVTMAQSRKKMLENLAKGRAKLAKMRKKKKKRM